MIPNDVRNHSAFYFHGSYMGRELTPRERRHQRTQQAILDAARRIIAQEGIDNLSMRGIAKAIDHSPAGLYEYFGGKDEIIQAVCQQGHARLIEYMGRADASLPVDEYLIELGTAYIDFAVRNPDHFLLMFASSATGASPSATQESAMEEMAMEGSSFGLLLGAVQRGIDEGVFQAREGYGTLEMAHTAWAMVHGMAMLRLGHLAHFPMNFAAVEQEGLQRLNSGLKGG